MCRSRALITCGSRTSRNWWRRWSRSWRGSSGAAVVLPRSLRRRELFFEIVPQLLRPRYMAFVNGAVVIAKGFAQGVSGGTGQGAAGHGAEDRADGRDELDRLAACLTHKDTRTQAPCNFQE